MGKSATTKRRRQLKGEHLGILKWQGDFWLALIERALGGGPGPSDLHRLKGFENPAMTRHAVTTPDLLRSFRQYNSGKPYHKQVRPFGFMLMFQQEDVPQKQASAGRHKPASTMLRIVSPFDRNPGKAARTAFDRDTGARVPPGQLKTYVRVLRSYHAHPEAKFLNGDRAERGPTQRRHVVVSSVRHIGKEANRLDDQMAMGVDPSAQAEFGDGRERLRSRIAAIKSGIEAFGPVAIAQAANVSRQHLFNITRGKSIPAESVLTRIERALITMHTAREQSESMIASMLSEMKEMVQRIGLRRSAKILDVSPGYLSRILSGARTPSRKFVRRVLSDQPTH